MKLSERLRGVAAMVTPGNPVTDVGTDHGYLPIYLVENKLSPSAVASDINPGPLGRAEENIRALGLEAEIRTVLCDGVPEENLKGTLVIAGMGGILMGRILENAGSFREGYNEFVLSPQSDAEYFRRTLSSLNLVIADEDMLFDMGKYYPVIRAVHGSGNSPLPSLTIEELAYGPVLIRKRHPVLKAYLDKEMTAREKILENLSEKGMTEHPRFSEIQKELRMARKVRQLFDE